MVQPDRVLNAPMPVPVLLKNSGQSEQERRQAADAVAAWDVPGIVHINTAFPGSFKRTSIGASSLAHLHHSVLLHSLEGFFRPNRLLRRICDLRPRAIR